MNNQPGAAIQGATLIADLEGHLVHRAEFGGVDAFKHLRTREDVVAAVEQSGGKRLANIFREVVERYESEDDDDMMAIEVQRDGGDGAE
jgi:hypothetical protein